jgi:uncharacterized protein DUF4166
VGTHAYLQQTTHSDSVSGDSRFRSLLSNSEWNSLSSEVRQRFSKRISGEQSAVYVGEIVEAELNWFGAIFVQLARLIGAPLPLRTEIHVPAVVTVTEDRTTGGQIWTRLYGSRHGLPQVIHTSKQFAGITGLEEILGFGFGMSLAVSVERGSIVFRSLRFFFRAFACEWTLPRFLRPGELTVTHTEEGSDRFAFSLDIEHPRFGQIVHQRAIFKEVVQ